VSAGPGEARERVLEAVRELESEHSGDVPERVLVERLSGAPRELVEDAGSWTGAGSSSPGPGATRPERCQRC
jgi:hypothetical protein